MALANEAEGLPAPPALVDRPELPDHLRPVWDAFWDLDPDRAVHFGGIGPIPFLVIDRYADRFGIEGRDEFTEFLELIRAMDRAFLEDYRRRHPPKE